MNNLTTHLPADLAGEVLGLPVRRRGAVVARLAVRFSAALLRVQAVVLLHDLVQLPG